MTFPSQGVGSTPLPCGNSHLRDLSHDSPPPRQEVSPLRQEVSDGPCRSRPGQVCFLCFGYSMLTSTHRSFKKSPLGSKWIESITVFYYHLPLPPPSSTPLYCGKRVASAEIPTNDGDPCFTEWVKEANSRNNAEHLPLQNLKHFPGSI